MQLLTPIVVSSLTCPQGSLNNFIQRTFDAKEAYLCIPSKGNIYQSIRSRYDFAYQVPPRNLGPRFGGVNVWHVR